MSSRDRSVYKCRKATAIFCVYYFKTYGDLDLGLLLGTEGDATLPAYTTVMQVWRYFSAGWLCRAQLVLNCNTSNHGFHVQYSLYFRLILKVLKYFKQYILTVYVLVTLLVHIWSYFKTLHLEEFYHCNFVSILIALHSICHAIYVTLLFHFVQIKRSEMYWILGVFSYVKFQCHYCILCI